MHGSRKNKSEDESRSGLTSKPRVLHIDDNPDILTLFPLQFGKFFHITSADSGETALEILKSDSVDVVITDYEMPAMNGLELLKILKNQHSDIPVIFYTGQGNESIAREAFMLGVSDYLTKEVRGIAQKEKIINAVNQALRRKETEDALREQQKRVIEQLSYSRALNRISEVILSLEEIDIILFQLNKIIDETLETDRSLIYYVDFEERLIKGFCEWLNPHLPHITPTLGTYPIETFLGGAEYMREHKNYLESHYHAPSSHLLRDGSWELLHNKMDIKSLLWFPFSFSPRGYYVLVLNQISRLRTWRKEELEFIDAVEKQVSLAIQKIRYIEEKRNVLEAFRETTAQLRTLINSMPDIVCFKDGQGRWIEANDFDLNLFQLEGVPYQGKKDSELAQYSDFYRDAFLTCEVSDEKAWEKGSPLRCEEIIPRPDGTVKIFDIIKVPVFHPDGSRKGLVVIGRDITEKKILMQEKEQGGDFLWRSPGIFRSILDATGSAMVFYDQDATILIANQEFEELSGYPREEIEGIKKWTEFVVKEDLERMLKYHATRRTSPQDVPSEYEFNFINSKGEIKKVYVKVRLISQPPVNVASFRDITGEKEIQEKYRYLVETSQDIIFICDIDGKISFVNSTFEKILGKKAEETMGTRLLDYIVPEERNDFFSSLVRRIRTDRSDIGFETKMMTTQGKIRILRFNCSPMKDKEGTFIGIMGTGRDITQSKKMETELMNKNRELSDFAYMVSHDLKTPLTIMQGFLYAIKENPETFDNYFHRIIRQSDAMISFINNLLNLSRAGKIIGDKRKINLENLIKKVYILLKPVSVEAELTIRSPLPHIYGDPKGMEHIFFNLIQNSIKYRNTSAEKLEIHIKGELLNNHDVVISFKDNGMGISADSLDKIFDPGFALKRNKGTGFGLAIVKKIVSAHHGTIWAESQGKDQGTEFFIRFPDPASIT